MSTTKPDTETGWSKGKKLSKRRTIPVVNVPFDKWIALTKALEASPDILVADLIIKAERLVASRKRYAQQVIQLEGKLLRKCPDLDS